MTFSNDFYDQINKQEAQYPVLFGITFTPLVSGITFAILGILGSAYVWSNYGQPVLDQYNQFKSSEASKEQEIAQANDPIYQQKIKQAQMEIDQQLQLQKLTYSLFANEQSSDTLLLDINRFVKLHQITLKSYIPSNLPVVISDNSFGPLINNKLKRNSFNLEISGDFAGIHSFLQDIERMQPLILIKNFTANKVNNSNGQNGSNHIVRVFYNNPKFSYQLALPSSKISANFRLDLISPLSETELEKANTPQPSPSSK